MGRLTNHFFQEGDDAAVQERGRTGTHTDFPSLTHNETHAI